VKALSAVYRGKFIAAIEEERANARLREDPALTNTAWRELKGKLYVHDWVVYAKQPLGGPAQVLEYLGRYTHRVAISNERIVAIDDDAVAFRVRVNGEGGGKKRTLRLPGTEFIARFVQHVLPRGFKRIRHYGLLGAAHKNARLAAARTALAAPQPQPAVIESVAAFMQRVAKIEWVLAKGTNRCNCSICIKAGAWFAFVGDSDFRLLTSPDEMGEYRWTPEGQLAPFLTYRFCKHCGIRIYADGEHESMGGKFFALNILAMSAV